MADDTRTTQSEAAQNAQAERGLQGSTQSPAARGESIDVQQRGRSGALGQRRGRGVARHRQHPFALMHELADEMDHFFQSFFPDAPARRQEQWPSAPTLWSPEVDVSETGNQLRVSVDLPGLSKDNVSIDVQERTLVIQGERREERSEGGGEQGFRRTEKRYGSFYREIPLPEYIDTDKAEARMQDGVLNITFPVTEQRKRGRRLEIQG